MAEKFTPKEETIGKLLKNNRFIVPKYQRYYSWKEESIIYLEDLLEIIEKKEEYFIGPMILSSKEKSEFTIIDGQQRLITTAIFISVVRDIYAKKGFPQKAEKVFTYLVEEEVYSSGTLRLTPNRIDKKIFESIVNNRSDFEEKEKIATEMIKEKKYESWRNIWLFYRECYNKIIDILDSKSASKVEKFLGRIIEAFDKDIKVIAIEVKDEGDAYLIFETLNDRGLQLSMADLLKNYLFSKLLDENLIDEYEIRWGSFLEEIGASKFVKFIRYYWIAKFEFIREKELFRKIKSKIKDKNKSIKLIEDLEKSKKDYLNIIAPSFEFWKREDTVDYLDDLRLIGITQHIPLIFSLLDKYRGNKNEIYKKITPIYATLLRRVVCKRNPNELEKELSNICNKIKKGSFNDVKKSLKKVNPVDSEVLNALENFEFIKTREKNLAKALLRLLNNEDLRNIKTNKDLTLEHIIPVSKSNTLTDKNLVNKLGNLTLLSFGENSKLGNKPFKDKLKVFLDSGLHINKELKVKDEWADEEPIERTGKLSNRLIRILKY